MQNKLVILLKNYSSVFVCNGLCYLSILYEFRNECKSFGVYWHFAENTYEPFRNYLHNFHVWFELVRWILEILQYRNPAISYNIKRIQFRLFAPTFFSEFILLLDNYIYFDTNFSVRIILYRAISLLHLQIEKAK